MGGSGISAASDSQKAFWNICEELQFGSSFELACLSELKDENVKQVAEILQNRSNDTSNKYTQKQHDMFKKHIVTIKKIGDDISSDLSTIFSKLPIKNGQTGTFQYPKCGIVVESWGSWLSGHHEEFQTEREKS